MLDVSIIAARDRLLDIPHSMADTIDPPIYRALVALKPDNLKLGPWAESAGLARNYFNYLRRHGNPSSENLQALLDAIGASYTDLAAHMPVGTEVVAPAIVGTADVRRQFYGSEPLAPLKLVGTAAGGDYGNIDDHIELHELLLSEVLGYLKRPASLALDPDAYALTILGDSMFPRYKPQEQVAVTPRQPVAIGDDVIVQLRGIEGENERIKLVLIKELVRRTGSYVELRQYNPEKVFRVEAARVAKIHKVAGRLF